MIDCSTSHSSDEDQMIQMKDIEIFANDDDNIVLDAGNTFIMDSSNSPNGYTVLHPYTLSDKMNSHEMKARLQSCLEFRNVLYLSSTKFLQYRIELVANIQKSSPQSYHTGKPVRHGPCAMRSYVKHEKDSDVAIGLKCYPWPKESIEWITRKRKSNWPDQSLVNKIKQMPCHALPIGHPESEKYDLEWRFAYILPERELIWNFNDIQIKCYVIFKTLIKTFLCPIALEEINSFHLKTILFWLSEKIIDWTPKSLISHVKTCLRYLYEAITKRELSHYFLRSRNLFSEKLKNKAIIVNLRSEIRHMKKNVISHFLQSSWTYKRGGPYLSLVRLVPHGLSDAEFLNNMRTIVQEGKNNKIKRNIYRHTRYLSMEATLSIMHFPFTCENLMKVCEEITELKEELMGIYSLKFLSTRFGMLYLAEAKRTADNQKRKEIFKMANWFFETGFDHDTLAAPLYSVTCLYQKRDYSAVKQFLQNLFRKRLAMVYSGSPGLNACHSRYLISTDLDEEVSEKDIANENDIAFDVVFSCSDVPCVPHAIQLECALLIGQSNWCFCSIHPLVYAAYLQFQVAINLNEVDNISMYLELLRKTVNYIEGEGNVAILDFHRHYNILGFCYYVTMDFDNAVKWLIKSLQVCPSSRNAAVYHLCILISNITTRR